MMLRREPISAQLLEMRLDERFLPRWIFANKGSYRQSCGTLVS